MSAPFFFGEGSRTLYGLLHARDGVQPPADTALLLCTPLLQDAVRSHRALWALAQAVGSCGVPTLTFDWYGTGDSAGDDTALTVAGMLDDLHHAAHELKQRSGARDLQWLALRSGALPMLSYLSRCGAAVDAVLWDPQLDGARVVEGWREQHRQQLHESGRYLHARHDSDADELLGFGVSDALLAELSAIDAARLPLPRGSRVRVAVWEMDEELDRFARAQRTRDVSVEAVLLDEGERPEWTVPSRFGGQVFPRRAVAQLAQRMTAQVPW